jgi:2-dehydropantoate 2-reductase
MKIAIMGAGALGCYFGGRIANVGGDVAFIARGAHLDALQRDGLRIESPLGDAHVHPVRATSEPAEIGPVDLVMVLVKLYDTDAAAAAIAPLIGPDTAVVSFQNGIDAAERIGAVVGLERVFGGTAVIPADIRAPGIVRHNGGFAKLTFGEFDGLRSARCEALLAVLETAGIESHLVSDIATRIWEKFVFLSAMSAITALTRLPLGAVLADDLCARIFQRALNETFSVGKQKCPDLPGEDASAQMEFAATLPYHMRASMLDDLERGKKLELNHLSGAVVRLGKETGTATPVHAFVQAALQPYADGPPVVG